MNIVIFGSQGSGKSTYAKFISEKLEVPYLSSGEMFREIEGQNSSLGEEIRDLLKKGQLVPDELTVKLFNQYLKKFDLSKGFVLEGFPRTLNQSNSFNLKVAKVFVITLPEEVAIKRLMERKRSDDTPASIRKRLDLFRKQTLPVLNFFKKKGVEVHEIDNSPSIEEVKKVIDDYLKN